GWKHDARRRAEPGWSTFLVHAPVPQRVEEAESLIHERGRVPRHEASAGTEGAIAARPHASRADRERATVGRARGNVVARRARDVAIAAEDLVEEQRLSERDQRRV